MTTRLYFIRHGESEANRSTLFAGSLDMPLTEKGRAQAEATAAFLQDIPFTAVYASDLKRAFDTGAAVARLHGLESIPMQQLREIFAGQWEGKTYTDLEREFADSYDVWKNNIGLAACPGGESVVHLQERVRACVERIVHSHPGEIICIATHATPIRVMECLWTHTPLEHMHTIPWVSNASVTIAEYDNSLQARLVKRDIHHHLGELHTVLAKNV